MNNKRAKSKDAGQSLLIFIVFAIIGFTLYSNVLNGEFISDDYITVLDNASIRSLTGIKDIWRDFNTRFIVGYTFALNFALGGLHVIGYHIVNIAIHVLATCCVYSLINCTFKTPEIKNSSLKNHTHTIALYASLIFLCHPIQTQAVSYITQRAASLATLLYLSALLGYVQFRLKGQSIYFIGALISMMIGALTKEMTITIPVMICTYEFFFFSPSWKKIQKSFKYILPFFFILALFPLIFLQDQLGSVLNLKAQIHTRTFNWQFFLTEFNVLCSYLRLMILPFNQMHDYDYPLVSSITEPRLWFSFVILLGLILTAVKSFSKQRIFSFCIVWFFIATSVEVMVVTFVNRGVIYEHWIYLAMVGFAFFAVSAIIQVLPIKIARILLPLIVMMFAVLTYQRNFVWQSEIRFWEDNVAKSPSKPYLGLCVAYHNKNLDEKALHCYQSFLARMQMMSDEKKKNISVLYLSRAHNNIGLIYFMHNHDKEALRSFKKALEYYSKNARVYNNLGMYYYFMGNFNEAIDHYTTSINLQGDYPYAFYYMGLSYQGLGNEAVAKQLLIKSQKLFKNFGDKEKVEELESLLKDL